MESTTEIRCPKCSSNQLTSNKKGFSGTKAVGGALLTGGIGLLAGTIGSNKIIITCLACGNKFKPGEGKVVTISQNFSNPHTIQQSVSENVTDQIDLRILEISQQKGKLDAIKFCKEAKDWDLSASKEYVDKLTAANGIAGKKEGCFIATACFDDYNSPEVKLLRNYRDNVLSKNYPGRLFIKIYYFISPGIANKIRKSSKVKLFIRNHILKHIVTKVEQAKIEK